MLGLDRLTQDRLAIFVSDIATGGASSRVPLYAELTLHEEVPAWRMTLADLDVMAGGGLLTSDSFRDLLQEAIGARLDEPTFRALDDGAKRDLAAVIADRLGADRALARGDEATRRAAVTKAVEEGLAKIGVRPQTQTSLATVRRIPLGVLATDHAGYASFDLSRAKAALGVPGAAKRAIGVQVLPFGDETLRIDVLEQRRLMPDVIVGRLQLNRPMGEGRGLAPPGMPSLQRPGLADWFLSPGSFAANPAKLIGEDGCENLFPGQLALQEFVLRQIVRLSVPPEGTAVPEAHKAGYLDEYRVTWQPLGHSLGEILYSLPLAPGETVKLAVIDWSWVSEAERGEQTTLDEAVLHRIHRDRLITETVAAGVKEMQSGDSFMAGYAATVGLSAGLGPLGLAVGSALSLGGATSSTEGSRSLAAENVQRIGDSFAQASSARRSLNSTVVMEARQEEKQAIQTRSFTNHNRGHTLTVLYYEVLRHFRVAVEWVRRRPVLLRKISEAIPTLALPAGDAGAIPALDAALLAHRHLIEGVLLDAGARPGFDALEKVAAWRAEYERAGAAPPNQPVQPARPFSEGDIGFSLFEFMIKSPDDKMQSEDKIVIRAVRRDGGLIPMDVIYSGPPQPVPATDAENINRGNRFNVGSGNQYILLQPRPDAEGKPVFMIWSDLAGFQIEKWGDEDWRIIRLGLRGYALGPEPPVDLIPDGDVYHEFIGKEPSSQAVMWIRRPAPDLPAPPAELPLLQRLTGEEFRAVQRLRSHVVTNAPAYRRVLALARAAENYAAEFETAAWDANTTFADKVMPTPLEVTGSFVAFPYIEDAERKDVVAEIADLIRSADPAKRQEGMDRLARLTDGDLDRTLTRLALSATRSDRLVSLPTRGVFAEGKLGHCSVAEEIDETRFWRWDEHPLAVNAPDINPVTPITPQPQAVNLVPTPFPQPIINVVAPAPAPDPAGLAAALALLGQPNIFRDMSGRQEVAGLLKGLSDNTIKGMEAANKAAEIQAKYGDQLERLDRPAPSAGGGSAGGGTPPTGGGSGHAGSPTAPTTGGAPAGPQATPEQREAQQITNNERKLEVARKYLSPKKAAPVQQAAADDFSKKSRPWRITVNCKWAGEFVTQPITALINGELAFDTMPAVEGGKLLNNQFITGHASWDAPQTGRPLHLSIRMWDIWPVSTELAVDVPAMKVEDWDIQATKVKVPLRAPGQTLPTHIKALCSIDQTKVNFANPTLAFEANAILLKKDIELSFELGGEAEIGAEIGRAFEKSAAVEVVKIAVNSTLKAAVKTTVNGKAGIKGTFEITYLKGLELKMA